MAVAAVDERWGERGGPGALPAVAKPLQIILLPARAHASNFLMKKEVAVKRQTDEKFNFDGLIYMVAISELNIFTEK